MVWRVIKGFSLLVIIVSRVRKEVCIIWLRFSSAAEVSKAMGQFGEPKRFGVALWVILF